MSERKNKSPVLLCFFISSYLISTFSFPVLSPLKQGQSILFHRDNHCFTWKTLANKVKSQFQFSLSDILTRMKKKEIQETGQKWKTWNNFLNMNSMERAAEVHCAPFIDCAGTSCEHRAMPINCWEHKAEMFLPAASNCKNS